MRGGRKGGGRKRRRGGGARSNILQEKLSYFLFHISPPRIWVGERAAAPDIASQTSPLLPPHQKKNRFVRSGALVAVFI